MRSDVLIDFGLYAVSPKRMYESQKRELAFLFVNHKCVLSSSPHEPLFRLPVCLECVELNLRKEDEI